jgi:hypothetical protein
VEETRGLIAVNVGCAEGVLAGDVAALASQPRVVPDDCPASRVGQSEEAFLSSQDPGYRREVPGIPVRTHVAGAEHPDA